MWANLAYGILMIVQRVFSHHDAWKMLTDVPYILLLAFGIAVLRSDRQGATASMALSHVFR